MIVIKAPVGFDPTWPAIPVEPPNNPICWYCTDDFGPGERCGYCGNEPSPLDLAALLGPKDEDRLLFGEVMPRRVPQRVALAIETPCETCQGEAAVRFGPRWQRFACPSPDCVVGVRLRVEYTCLVARIERDGDRWMVHLEDVTPVAPTLIGHFEGITEMEASWLPVS